VLGCTVHNFKEIELFKKLNTEADQGTIGHLPNERKFRVRLRMSAHKSLRFKSHQIAQSFSCATKTYDRHAFIQNEIGHRLLERLCLLKDPPKVILDVGSGTGKLTQQIQRQFPNSAIFGLDLAFSMCDFAQQSNTSGTLHPSYVCANTQMLPFQTGSIDMIFSNCCLQWCDLPYVFSEFKRVLSPQGILFFSTFGPRTLIELKDCWQQVCAFQRVNAFMDMHDIGDLLLNLNFMTPVVDMEMICATFLQPTDLLKYLKNIGARNLNLDRPQGLTSRRKFEAMLQAYHTLKLPNGLFPATFEVIYGHAFQNDQTTYARDEDGLVRIPASNIPILD